MRPLVRILTLIVGLGAAGTAASAQLGQLAGIVRDETGGALSGVAVELRGSDGLTRTTATDAAGEYSFDNVSADRYQVTFTLVNFATVRRDVRPKAGAPFRLDAVLHLALNADVTVTGKRTFTNLADAERPAENLVGIAQSASQGAITARQLDTRPLMRTGEVLETVPGVVISQHSGEGKANQYYLRGFNLDHGTDFATTVAGMPVNMPTHAHGHGYSDLNFLIPELVSGVQYSKGPYFADQGDFATAGAANINYANVLDGPIARVGGGGDGYGRALVAASPRAGAGRLLAALEVDLNDGPWDRPDDYRKLNGLVRYSQGAAVNGFAITGMAYHGKWFATDQVPRRAVARGVIGRLGALDSTDGGDSSRYSGSLEWQRARDNTATKLTAYGIAYDLNLFSNFTFFLDDPEHGDQFHQTDHRFVTGVKISHRRLNRWAGRAVQNTFGVQVRNDDITKVGLSHTEARALLEVVRQDSVLQTSGALYAQNEVVWTPWLRSLAGLRADGYRFHVEATDPLNGGTARAGLVSPTGGLVVGPFAGTEFYANAGYGFHSNDARGVTIARDPSTLRLAQGRPEPSRGTTGATAARATPLARATGAEVGIRTVAIGHLQSSVAVWSLGLESELVFVGDAGTTEAGRRSRRYGLELANYYSLRPWLTLDGDVAWSRGRFTGGDPDGDRIPGSVQTVVSGGAAFDGVRRVFGSVRLRYFGPRPLVENDSVRSKATTLVNVDVGYKLSRKVRLALDVFNLVNAEDSDVDYYYVSRLPGEPRGGVADLHFHPTLPRTARLNLMLAF